jgi:hypothetical protein
MALKCAMKLSIRYLRCSFEVKLPRRSILRIRMENQISIWLIQEECNPVTDVARECFTRRHRLEDAGFSRLAGVFEMDTSYLCRKGRQPGG